MAAYLIKLDIERLPEGPYLGTSPDLPGLIIQAETAEEVLRLAPDIAHDLIEVMIEGIHRRSKHQRTVSTE